MVGAEDEDNDPNTGGEGMDDDVYVGAEVGIEASGENSWVEHNRASSHIWKCVSMIQCKVGQDKSIPCNVQVLFMSFWWKKSSGCMHTL